MCDNRVSYYIPRGYDYRDAADNWASRSAGWGDW
jgi:hypothetical protein